MGVFAAAQAVGVSMGPLSAAWRLEALTGVGNRTLTAREAALLGTVSDGLLLLVDFAIVAGITLVFRASPRAPALKVTASQDHKDYAAPSAWIALTSQGSENRRQSYGGVDLEAYTGSATYCQYDKM
jgi:hypothetical protein